MKNQLNQLRQILPAAAIATIFLLGAFGSTFAQKKGAITQEEVKEHFVHWWTHECAPKDECAVVFDGAVRIAPAVRHTFGDTSTYLTYPVKVDFTTHYNGGWYHLRHHTRGVYYFYRNSFGDWEMGKEDERIKEEKDEHQDGGTTKAPVAANQTKGGGQTNTPKAENKTTAVNGKDENGFPKPDFSAMEKWFEIVRYEYPEMPERNMTIFIKPKVDFKQRMMFFKMEFLDKDGVLVGTDLAWICCSTQLGDTETGKVGKVTVQVPSEREMEKVVSTTIVRIKQ